MGRIIPSGFDGFASVWVLATLDLAWVNYQVLRRSAASLMNQLGIDGKTVADQLGHGLNVSKTFTRRQEFDNSNSQSTRSTTH